MNRAKLSLLASPALVASMLVATHPVDASEIGALSQDTVVSELVFERPTAQSSASEFAEDVPLIGEDCGCFDEKLINFTEAESNAAIKRFGCDCVACINIVRQLQGKLPLS